MLRRRKRQKLKLVLKLARQAAVAEQASQRRDRARRQRLKPKTQLRPTTMDLFSCGGMGRYFLRWLTPGKTGRYDMLPARDCDTRARWIRWPGRPRAIPRTN